MGEIQAPKLGALAERYHPMRYPGPNALGNPGADAAGQDCIVDSQYSIHIPLSMRRRCFNAGRLEPYGMPMARVKGEKNCDNNA